MRFASRKIFVLFLAVIAACVPLGAQDKGAIVSGNYDSLMIAVNSTGELTGYFNEGSGNDNGHPRFTCTFFIAGEKQADGSYKVSTWYPADPLDEVVTGTLKAVTNDGKPGVNLHLDAEHGGCWNVAPRLKEAGGVDFDLDSPGKWEGIRMISPAKAYFFMSAEAGAPQKIFVVKNDAVSIISTKGDWAEVSFTSDSDRTTKGWMKRTNFYSIKPPAAK